MTDKKELVKQFIENRPNLSGNKIYDQIKGKDFSIRKTDFYFLLREIRNLPEPSIEKKERSVPIKYKIEPSVITEPKKVKKEGQYGVAEIEGIDINGNKITKWIKYTDKKDFNNQLNIVKKEYNIEKLDIIFHGFRNYTEFIDKDFKELLNEVGIFS